jgi:DNA-3-methyladenine glycosylase
MPPRPTPLSPAPSAPVHPGPEPRLQADPLPGSGPAPVTGPAAWKRLPRAFFDRDTARVAEELIGRLVVRNLEGRWRVGRIVETEAYVGPHDLASHSRRGPTPSNRSMFGPPGHAYVYQIYGLHHCLNVVTEPEGHGSAVLLRAIEPICGIDGRTQGPGLVCRALGVDRRLDGVDLGGEVLWLADPEVRPTGSVVRSRRIGIDYAGAWARRLLRFHLRGNPFVSRPRG